MSPTDRASPSVTDSRDWPKTDSVRRLRQPLPRRPAVTFLILAIYLGLAFVEFGPAWIHGASHWLQSQGQFDAGQAVFFMAEVPGALIHGLNPLANSWTDWPYGANYMNNTAVPLLSLIMSPVTLAAGPIFSLNLLFTVTVWANCVVCYLVVGHFTRDRLAAFAAGLLYGFSPMATGGGFGHVQVVFDLLPPIMFLLLWRLCTRVGSAVWNGLALGVAMVLQLYIFPEPLADCVVVAAVGLLAAAIIYRRQLAGCVRHVATGLATAAGTFVLFGGFGIYMILDGPDHVIGNAHPGNFSTLSADLFSTVLPSQNQRFTLGMGPTGAHLTAVTVGTQVVPDAAESGAYLGFPLLAVLIAGVVLLWRRPLMRWAAGLAVVTFIFSLGNKLRVDGHATPVGLPFGALVHAPLMGSAVAARFAMVEWFFLALMFGLILTDLRRYLESRWRSRSRGRMPGPASLAVAAVALVALIPLIPSWRYTEGPVALPSLAVGPQLRSLPVGTVVLGYPFPTANTYLMVFQAEDKMRFRIVGGSLIQRSNNGHNLNSAAPPSTCQSVLNGYFMAGQPAVPLTAPVFAGCAAEMLQWNVNTVLWTGLGAQPAAAREFFTAMLGPPSVTTSAAALWLHPQAALHAVVADGGVAAIERAAGRQG